MGGESDSEHEMRQRLGEALSRFGVAGSVAVTGTLASLHGSGPTVTTELGALVDQWPDLPEDARQRRINEVARRLAGERRSLSGGASEPSRFTMPDWLPPLGIAAAAVIAIFGAWVLYQQWVNANRAREERPLIADYDAYERERLDRASRVCEATRSRVMRGAAVGPSDVEGWVVELWALRTPTKPVLAADPALALFFAPLPGQGKSGVVWTGAASLSGLEGPETNVAITEANVPATGAPMWRGLRVTLSGRYVVPYFHEQMRFDYLRFARALTDALGVDYAALYARCADGQSHHLGGWFRGPTPGGAVTSLLYFMGTFAEHPDIRASSLAPVGATGIDPAFAFRSVANASAALKKTRVMAMVGAEAGMISGLDDQVSTVTFPFRDSNRASRASRIIARDLGIGESR